MHIQSYISQSDSGAGKNELPEKGLNMFASITRLYRAWRRHETVVRELSHLSDRELADIGITRSDIDRIASDYAHH